MGLVLGPFSHMFIRPHLHKAKGEPKQEMDPSIHARDRPQQWQAALSKLSVQQSFRGWFRTSNDSVVPRIV